MRQRSVRHDLKTYSGKKFTLYQSGNGPRQIILIHGWSGRGTQFYKLAQALEKDYTLLAIDAPGHGDNAGGPSTMLDFVAAMEKTVSVFGKPYAAIGHSLGGMAVFNALRIGLNFNKVIILGTPSTIPNVIGDFCDRIKANQKVAEGLINYLENRYNLEINEVSTKHLAATHNPRGLIFHDEDDQDVPLLNAYEINEAWTNGQLHLSKGLGHRRILNDKKVINRIYDFLNN